MFLIEVSPIKNLRGFKKLSYFSSVKYKRGSIITVPFKNKDIHSVVLRSKELKSVKADVKNSDFKPKKIKKQVPLDIVSDQFTEAVFKTSRFLLRSEGDVVRQMVPTFIFKHHNKIKTKSNLIKSHLETADKIHKQILNGFQSERIEIYKAVIRQRLALNQTSIIITNNMQNARKIYDYLSVGISSMIFLLDSDLSPVKFIKNLNQIQQSDTPICVIGTDKTLLLQLSRLGLIIVDQTISQTYFKLSKPVFDTRIFIKYYAEAHNADILFADSFLRLKDYEDFYQEQAHAIDRIPRRFRKNTRIRNIDTSKEIEYSKEYKLSYPVVSRQIIGEIQNYLSLGKKIFVYSPRAGIAGQTVCNDCANILSCPKCRANLRLQRVPGGQETHFICKRCGYGKHSNIQCPHCGSWKLKALGAGIDRIQEYLTVALPKINIYQLDSSTAPTGKKATELINKFFADSQSILLGTSRALSFLSENQITYSAVISLDSLLSVPDFRIEEKIFGTLSNILNITDDRMDIQIKDNNIDLFKLFEKKELQKFVRQELSLRKKYMWPPYVTLIKISLTGTRNKVISDMQKFIDLLAKYKPRVFRDFIYLDEKNVELSAMLRIPTELWPEEVKKLTEKLKSLPPNFTIEINPQETY